MNPLPNERTPRAFCLFLGGSRPLGVGLEIVAEVVESSRLVRVPLCPRPVLGLLTYRGKVVPILGLGSTDRDGHSADPAGPGHAFLVLKTRHGLWGLAIDRPGVQVEASSEPKPFDGNPPPGGFVVNGAVDHDGKTHAILDHDQSWRGVRSEVERWYRLAIEGQQPAHSARETTGVGSLPR